MGAGCGPIVGTAETVEDDTIDALLAFQSAAGGAWYGTAACDLAEPFDLAFLFTPAAADQFLVPEDALRSDGFGGCPAASASGVPFSLTLRGTVEAGTASVALAPEAMTDAISVFALDPIPEINELYAAFWMDGPAWIQLDFATPYPDSAGDTCHADLSR